MKTIVKTVIIMALMLCSQKSIAQLFTKIKYEYDATGNRWQRRVIFNQPTLNKTTQGDTTSTDTANAIKPYKETMIDTFGLKQIIVYPNPTEGMMQINIESLTPSPLLGSIKVYNMQGSTMYINNVLQNQNVLDLTALASGNYLLKLDVNRQIKTYQIIKN